MSWKKNIVLLWKCIILHAINAIIWSEQNKVDKVFIVKQKTNLVKTWSGEGGGERHLEEAFYWYHGS